MVRFYRGLRAAYFPFRLPLYAILLAFTASLSLACTTSFGSVVVFELAHILSSVFLSHWHVTVLG